MRDRLDEFLLTVPSFSWLCFFFIVPACIVVSIAFHASDWTGSVLPGWTLSSIETLWSPAIAEVAWRTLILATLTMCICVATALPVAFYMIRLPPHKQRAVFLGVVIPMWSCFLVRIFAWKVVLHPEGIVKELLVSLHLVKESTSLLYNNFTVLLVMVYSYLPFAILPLYSTATKFDFHLFEAAMDLGATRRKAFRSVFLAHMRPAILTASLLVFIPAAGAYVIPEVVGGRSSEMLGNTIARRVFVDRDLPDASSLALLLAAIIFVPAVTIAVFKSPSRTSRK